MPMNKDILKSRGLAIKLNGRDKSQFNELSLIFEA